VQQAEIHEFLVRFFQANGCELIANEDGWLTVQLTVDLDKELMNRPFYWHYLEKTGGTPNPAKLTFITDPQRTPKTLKEKKSISVRPGCTKYFNRLRSWPAISGYMNRADPRPEEESLCFPGSD